MVSLGVMLLFGYGAAHAAQPAPDKPQIKMSAPVDPGHPHTQAVYVIGTNIKPIGEKAKWMLSKDWPGGVQMRYTSPEGIHFDSYTASWGFEDLRNLYLGFISGAHGEELGHLKYVSLQPNDNAPAGIFDAEWTETMEGKPIELLRDRSITIYHANDINTPALALPVLNHEYGHLFTYYWLIKKEGKTPDDPTTGWASVRNLGNAPVSFKGSGNEDHYWDPAEIMADDFVYLFSSPATKTHLLYSPGMKYDLSYASMMENIYVPAPETAKSLRSYWENLAGIQNTSNIVSMQAPAITSLTASGKRFGNGVQYEVQFTPGSLDPSIAADLQYFVQWGNQTRANGGYLKEYSKPQKFGPIVYTPSEYEYESTEGKSKVNKAYFRVLAYNTKTGQLIWSPMYWYDFSNRMKPASIPNQFQLK